MLCQHAVSEMVISQYCCTQSSQYFDCFGNLIHCLIQLIQYFCVGKHPSGASASLSKWFLCHWMNWPAGYVGIGMDILGGDFAVDLTDPNVIEVIIGLVVSGRVRAIHGGLPCESFSPARRGKRTLSNPRGYPSRVRSKKQLWGLPKENMVPGDLVCLDRGNACLRAFLRIIRVCLEHHVSVSLEQPANSLMWLIPELLALNTSEIASHGVLEADYCKVWSGLQEANKGVVLGSLDSLNSGWLIVWLACQKFRKSFINIDHVSYLFLLLLLLWSNHDCMCWLWGLSNRQFVSMKCKPKNKICSTSGNCHVELSISAAIIWHAYLLALQCLPCL